jgi:trk system potassium uptake protein TrkH
MNPGRVLNILGLLLVILAVAQLVPIAWCLSPETLPSAAGFLAGSGVTALLGAGFRYFGNADGELYRRDGVLIVVGAWLLASATGAIPYVATGAIPSAVDALFESASGFTTTGASVVADIEALGRPILFWRSMTQWLGGIGIIVLFVALLSELGPGARFLFKLEVPGPKAEIMHARVQETALALSRIYFGLTLALVVLLLLCGLSVFDATTHAFSTLSTGGFSPHQDSVAHFGPVVQFVIMLFMILAGINFSIYYSLLRQRSSAVLRDSELRWYLALMATAGLVVLIDVARASPEPSALVVLDAAFQVVSVVTTTGFATANFDEWPSLSRSALVALMLIGGCAGSTAGGAKVIRVLVGWMAAIREVRLTFNPSVVIAVVVGGKPVPEESVRSVGSLLLLWGLAWGVGALLLSAGDTGIVTAATASIATLSNIGPGLGAVGPEGNYAAFAAWQKLVMIFLMWLGRLEFFALLSLLLPYFWRR